MRHFIQWVIYGCVCVQDMIRLEEQMRTRCGYICLIMATNSSNRHIGLQPRQRCGIDGDVVYGLFSYQRLQLSLQQRTWIGFCAGGGTDHISDTLRDE